MLENQIKFMRILNLHFRTIRYSYNTRNFFTNYSQNALLLLTYLQSDLSLDYEGNIERTYALDDSLVKDCVKNCMKIHPINSNLNYYLTQSPNIFIDDQVVIR